MAFILRLISAIQFNHRSRISQALFVLVGYNWSFIPIKKKKGRGREKGEADNLRMFGYLAELEIFHSLVLQSFNLIIQATNHPAM